MYGVRQRKQNRLSESSVRISCVWLGCIPEDEIQVGFKHYLVSHDDLRDTLISSNKGCRVIRNQPDQRAPNEGVKGSKVNLNTTYIFFTA